MKTRFLRLLCLIGLVCCFSSPSMAFRVPDFRPNVVDASHTLSNSEIARLNSEIQKVHYDSHIFAAILLVDTLGGDSIDAAAVQTFRKWQLGQNGVDNGLLIIAAIQDRKVRIEVGYGLEGSLTDIVCKRLIDQVIAPHFRAAKYGDGLYKALDVANDIVKTGDSIVLKKPPQVAGKVILAGVLWIFFIIGLPFWLRRKAVLRAQNYPAELQPSKKEASVSGLLFGPVWFLTLFLVINPGVFFVIVISQKNIWWISPVFILFAYVFLGAANVAYFSMRSEQQRRALFEKLSNRTGLRKSALPTTNIWDSGFRTGGASGSSSGFSSSSSGGSSGGGGASGSW